MIHELKTWPEFFEAVLNDNKTFEVRRDDRGFSVGDTLHLKEYDISLNRYTGRELTKTVAYILRGGKFGIERGYVVMGLGTAPKVGEEAEKEADREAEREELWQPGDEPYEPDYWGAHYE